MYMGVATSAGEVNSDMVLSHADEIMDVVDDPAFKSYYESQYNAEYNVAVAKYNTEVVITDFEEGN